MAKIENEYIKKARKKRFIKKSVIVSILVIVCGVMLIRYTGVFAIENITCEGDDLVTKDYILEKTEVLKGENLMFINEEDVLDITKENPYIESVTLKKTYPSTLEIDVVEKKGLFYIFDGSSYNIISSSCIYLEKVESIEGKNLIELKGLDISGETLGENLSDSNRVTAVLGSIYDEQNEYQDKVQFTALDISDLSNIKLYINNIEILLGSDEDLSGKISKAIIIYENENVENYINVSFDGSPVFK